MDPSGDLQISVATPLHFPENRLVFSETLVEPMMQGAFILKGKVFAPTEIKKLGVSKRLWPGHV